jgi:hypothetical protein
MMQTLLLSILRGAAVAAVAMVPCTVLAAPASLVSADWLMAHRDDVHVVETAKSVKAFDVSGRSQRCGPVRWISPRVDSIPEARRTPDPIEKAGGGGKPPPPADTDPLFMEEPCPDHAANSRLQAALHNQNAG